MGKKGWEKGKKKLGEKWAEKWGRNGEKASRNGGFGLAGRGGELTGPSQPPAGVTDGQLGPEAG